MLDVLAQAAVTPDGKQLFELLLSTLGIPGTLIGGLILLVRMLMRWDADRRRSDDEKRDSHNALITLVTTQAVRATEASSSASVACRDATKTLEVLIGQVRQDIEERKSNEVPSR